MQISPLSSQTTSGTSLKHAIKSAALTLTVACSLAVHCQAVPRSHPQPWSSPATFTEIYNFGTGQDTDYSPTGRLVEGPDGQYYGVCSADHGQGAGGSIYKVRKDYPPGNYLAKTELHVFHTNVDGADPEGGLLLASDGNFYGTTFTGGGPHYGTIFKMAPDGTFTTVYSFSGPDGGGPRCELVEGSDGALYGTTYNGGNTYSFPQYDGAGTIFKITKSGVFTLLHSFNHTGSATDEGGPTSGLAFGPDGNLYGTTRNGGTTGGGVAYRISSTGDYAVIHNFTYTEPPNPPNNNYGDGVSPSGALTLGADGNFYGVTLYGGGGSSVYDPNAGVGTVYRLTPGGQYTTLHNFAGVYGNDGATPWGALATRDGHTLYGTTSSGGVQNQNSNFSASGTLFRISIDGSGYAVLYTGYASTETHPTYDCIDFYSPLMVDDGGDVLGVVESNQAAPCYGAIFVYHPGQNGPP